MKKAIFMLYATVCYLIFFVTFLYLIGFVENQIVPKSVDNSHLSTTTSWFFALLINVSLIALFGLQHSIMARKSFKQKIESFIPQPIERSTYVLVASVILTLLFYFWQPIPIKIWDFTGHLIGKILFDVSLLGWVIVLLSTFLINHFHLFGLHQVFQFVFNKESKENFKVPFLYKLVRHPLYLGFLIAFWATPIMTVGHLSFSIGMTIYILIGIHHEEKDLVSTHGNSYIYYRSVTPKLIPFTKRK